MEDSPLGKARRVVCYKSADENPPTGVDNSEVTRQLARSTGPATGERLLGAMYDCFGVQHADMVPDAGA